MINISKFLISVLHAVCATHFIILNLIIVIILDKKVKNYELSFCAVSLPFVISCILDSGIPLSLFVSLKVTDQVK